MRAQVGGILPAALYTEGVFVKRGTPLYKIDPAPYEVTLERLEAVDGHWPADGLNPTKRRHLPVGAGREVSLDGVELSLQGMQFSTFNRHCA